VHSSPRPHPPADVDLWLQHVQPRQPAGDGLLAPDERERAGRIIDDEARALFVLGRSLLRVALSTYLGCAPQALRLDLRCAHCGRQHGKPRLVAPVSDLAFNLSHTRGLIALAVCRGRAVGIDVEWRGRAPTMPELAPMVLAPAELEALEQVPDVRREQLLLDCWVRKEALLKATGEGLSRDPREVRLPLGDATPTLYRHEGVWWGVAGLDVGPDHAGALALRDGMPRPRRRSITPPSATGG
jgi:4'-phosphopantetheinyl transferase